MCGNEHMARSMVKHWTDLLTRKQYGGTLLLHSFLLTWMGSQTDIPGKSQGRTMNSHHGSQ